MPYRCSCGAEFTDVAEYAEHKRSHRDQKQAPKGVVCLGCGKPISTPENYSGMVSCPSCRKGMKVVVEKGEVLTARLG
jgi:DNA-directed RNA polymerase subunit RPC12/RpoP